MGMARQRSDKEQSGYAAFEMLAKKREPSERAVFSPNRCKQTGWQEREQVEVDAIAGCAYDMIDNTRIAAGKRQSNLAVRAGLGLFDRSSSGSRNFAFHVGL